jgi:hypothetical protein
MRCLVLLAVTAAGACGQDGFVLTPVDSPVQVDFRPSLEAVLWAGESPQAALLTTDDEVFFAPRLLLDVDAAIGDQWFFHASPRVDRGFDPGDRPDGDIRLDEILLRWRANDDQSLNFQIGSFPSVFGAWSGQHGFFDDPFLLAPLPYSQIIGIHTRDPAAISPAAISNRAAGTAPPVSAMAKDNWASMLWGPGYSTGAAVFGATSRFDYAFELKNSALSAHPDSWPELDFAYPTFTGRLGYRPDAAWAFGLSASRGSWLERDVAGVDRDDLIQQTLGLDVRWAYRDLIISGELITSQFDTPAAGDLRVTSGFVQARWKVSPGFWLAARFGQMLANDATGPAGTDVSWQPDVYRMEIGAGWRVTPGVLLKTTYALTRTDDDPVAGEHLWGTGIGWRF